MQFNKIVVPLSMNKIAIIKVYRLVNDSPQVSTIEANSQKELINITHDLNLAGEHYKIIK